MTCAPLLPLSRSCVSNALSAIKFHWGKSGNGRRIKTLSLIGAKVCDASPHHKERTKMNQQNQNQQGGQQQQGGQEQKPGQQQQQNPKPGQGGQQGGGQQGGQQGQNR